MLIERVREVCRTAVEKAFDAAPEEVTVDFTDKFGDLALNCFYLAKTLRKGPPQIAAAVAAELDGDDLFEAVEAVSGYVNLTVRRPVLFDAAIAPALADPGSFGAVAANDDSLKIMVEFASPNTNKPIHLGHIRNICLGESVARILEAGGNRVVRGNVVNDRGIHICKSMLAYRERGNGETPDSSGKKGDHLVGDYYVLFETLFREELAAFRASSAENADISREDFAKQSQWMAGAREMLQAWEAGDPEVRELWATMNGWVLEGFDKTYADLGITFDRIYFESETYKLGKEEIARGLEKGVFYKRPDGATEIDLTAEKLDKKVVLRSDGTSVYVTQDVGATRMKVEDFGLDGQIFVVGDEQIYHFKVLFSILDKLGYEWAKNLHHLAYGMVRLPEGKMKSREGTVVDADDLFDEVAGLAADEIRKREADLAEDELQARARSIGMSALKFMILSVTPQTTMEYDPKQSVAFDGDTGPYVLYAYARIRRMIEDSGIDEGRHAFDSSELGDPSEVRLALKLLEFPPVVARAAKQRNPALIATYLLQLAHAYHSHNKAVRILKAEREATRDARLALSSATSTALRRGLALLNIEPVDRM